MSDKKKQKQKQKQELVFKGRGLRGGSAGCGVCHHLTPVGKGRARSYVSGLSNCVEWCFLWGHGDIGRAGLGRTSRSVGVM